MLVFPNKVAMWNLSHFQLSCLPQVNIHRALPCLGLFLYTNNPTQCSAAATERSTSKHDLESPLESRPAHRLDSKYDSKSLSLVDRSMAAAEHTVGLVVYRNQDNGGDH